MTYSEQGEDEIILKELERLGFVGPGRVLDIGAWDGLKASNSAILIEREWSAVLVEASIYAFAKLLERYASNPKIVPIHAMIGIGYRLDLATIALKYFNDTDDDRLGVSTVIERHADSYKNEVNYKKYLTPCVESGIFVSMLKSVHPAPFEVVSIDIEGLSADLALLTPWVSQSLVSVIEHDGRVVEIAANAKAWDMRVVDVNDCNVILAKV